MSLKYDNYEITSLYHYVSLDDEVDDNSSQEEDDNANDKYDPQSLSKQKHTDNLGIFTPYDTVGSIYSNNSNSERRTSQFKRTSKLSLEKFEDQIDLFD